MTQTSMPRHLRRTPRALIVSRLISLAGCAAVLQPSAASAEAAFPVPPAGAAHDAPPPWSGNGGYPPPRPLARTRAVTPGPHPAVHPLPGGDGRASRPLFPRAAAVLDEKKARKAAMDRHPAGKGLMGPPAPTRTEGAPDRVVATTERNAEPPRGCGTRHRVQPGETLWGIASRRSRSSRPIDILRLSGEIYRLNKKVIGPDPDLILPGQLLELPESCTR